MDIDLERWNIDFSVCKSIRYHAYRRAYWDMLSNLSKILTIVSGTAVLVTIVGEFKTMATVMAIVVALTSAADLVLGFSERARIHVGLYRSFSILAQDIATNIKPDESTLASWKRRRLEIEMDEPFILDLLERRCYAEESISRGRAVNEVGKLKWWQIALSQVWILPSSPKAPPAQP